MLWYFDSSNTVGVNINGQINSQNPSMSIQCYGCKVKILNVLLEFDGNFFVVVIANSTNQSNTGGRPIKYFVEVN